MIDSSPLFHYVLYSLLEGGITSDLLVFSLVPSQKALLHKYL